MRSFKDKAGKPYHIDLNVGCILRVKAESEGRFDLFDPESKDGERTLSSILFAEHLSDWATIWELLYLLVQPQLGETTAAEFGESMAGDCLVAAQRALIAEWRDFFQGLQRPDLATSLERQVAYQDRAVEMVREKLNSPSLAGLDAKVEAKMAATLNSSLGDLEALFDKILAPTP